MHRRVAAFTVLYLNGAICVPPEDLELICPRLYALHLKFADASGDFDHQLSAFLDRVFTRHTRNGTNSPELLKVEPRSQDQILDFNVSGLPLVANLWKIS